MFYTNSRNYTMKVEFKNDLEKNLMHMTIVAPKRKFLNEEKIIITWKDCQKTLLDYSPPPKYSLGECANKHLKINNEYDNLLKQTWTFSLIPDKPKQNINIKPTKTKARSTRRKKNA